MVAMKDRLSSIFRLKSPHGRELPLRAGTIMGILNLTPDSFYDGGKYSNVDEAVSFALKMVEDGASIIDVGGESTRPGAHSVPASEEMRRVLPVIEALRDKTDVFISIDTYKSEVAEEALKRGADMVNDISGLSFDPNLKRVIADFSSPVVIMHIKGTPKDMQRNPTYDDVVREIRDYFKKRIEEALDAGIRREGIVLDPGIGFGKRLEHNLEILKNVEEFKKLGFPLLVGHSRKSFIGHVLGGIPPERRLEGTLAVTAYLYLKGIELIRVHDVKENKSVIELLRSIESA